MDVEEYLNRLGIRQIREPSFEFLYEIQNRHLMTIPFEDLDIPEKRIELDLNKIYRKIIPTRRGGFCYELNGLFHWLLNSLGFKTDMLSARVFNSQTLIYGPEYDHMTLLVHLEKDYLTDVGFGDSFRIPIEMPACKVNDISGHYRIVNRDNESYELLKENENEQEILYSFTTIPRILNDFKNMCDFQQDSQTSHFRTRMLCTVATGSGRITLSNNSLTITENKSKTRLDFKSPEDFHFYLRKYFGIEL